MKCQKCQINEANTHIKQVINGKSTEMYLCSKCANNEGITYDGLFADMQSEFENMLGSFFGNALPSRTEASRCKTCGSTYAEIARTGKVGCADCYNEFYEQLLPTIRKMHGNTTHCGKHSSLLKVDTVAEQSADTTANDVDKLQAELEIAIKEQNFEHAAELRDKIKELNNQN